MNMHNCIKTHTDGGSANVDFRHGLWTFHKRSSDTAEAASQKGSLSVTDKGRYLNSASRSNRGTGASLRCGPVRAGARSCDSSGDAESAANQRPTSVRIAVPCRPPPHGRADRGLRGPDSGLSAPTTQFPLPPVFTTVVPHGSLPGPRSLWVPGPPDSRQVRSLSLPVSLAG